MKYWSEEIIHQLSKNIFNSIVDHKISLKIKDQSTLKTVYGDAHTFKTPKMEKWQFFHVFCTQGSNFIAKLSLNVISPP